MKIVINNARLSFPSLWETAKFNGQDLGKYEATLLIPKDHDQIAQLQGIIKEVGKAELGKDWAKAKLCLKDGDEKTYDGYAGNWSLKATTKRQPKIVDADKSPLGPNDDRPYAGCYVNAALDIRAFKSQFGGSFITATLLALQFAADGESFGGNGDGYSDDDFGVVGKGSKPADPDPRAAFFEDDDDGDAPF